MLSGVLYRCLSQEFINRSKHNAMKTSITPRLNYRPDSAGRRALIVQVIHNRRRSILTTPYRLRPEEFDARRGRAVATNRGKAHLTLIRDANECIEEYIRQLRAIADRLHETGKPYTVSDITGTYKLGGDNRYVEIFAEHVARELENAGRFGTARSYRSLRSAWVKFAAHRQWRFSQLDGGTVSAFAAYLESRGRKRNTVTFYLRTLHALYNRARVYGCAPIHRDPFPNVSFKPARTPKLAVNRSLLRILATSDFGDRELNEARDMFLFSFYARGMSFVDICYLRKENIRGGTLHYERQKTHQPFSVALTPQLQEIISRYDDPASPWALPSMGRGMIRSAFRNEEMAGDMPPGKLYTFYRMALQYYITQLKKVSRSVGCRRLTFNVARHTWATEARGMGVPMPHISEGLGHTSERTTRCYLAQLDSGTVDRINEKVTKLY